MEESVRDSMGFEKYDKVHGMHHTGEVGGILQGTVYVFEKLDGANASVWIKDDTLYVASRNQVVASTSKKDPNHVYTTFRGLSEYIFAHEGILTILMRNPHLKLYGEWLVKHTINYPVEAQSKFYVFDVRNMDTGKFIEAPAYYPLIADNGIEHVALFDVMENPTLEDIKAKWLGVSDLGGEGEGLVLKNYDFTNKYGRNVYGKLVMSKFREMNAKVFGGPIPADAVEMKIAAVYVTRARIEKMINTIEMVDEPKQVSVKDTGQILGMVFHDIINEEMWPILKKLKYPTINFKKLQKECESLAKNIWFGILDERTNQAHAVGE